MTHSIIMYFVFFFFVLNSSRIQHISMRFKCPSCFASIWRRESCNITCLIIDEFIAWKMRCNNIIHETRATSVRCRKHNNPKILVAISTNKRRRCSTMRFELIRFCFIQDRYTFDANVLRRKNYSFLKIDWL